MLFPKSKLLHLAVVLLAAFIPLALIFGPLNLSLFVGSLLFAVAFSVVVAYWPLLQLAFNLTVKDVKLVDILTLAIVVTFFAFGMREGYVTLYRELFPLPGVGRNPEYFLPIAFTQYTAVVGGLLALAAINVEKGTSIMYNLPGWPRAVLAMAAGAVLGAILITINAYK